MTAASSKSPPSRGQGQAVAWIRHHATYQSDDCLTWPFGTNGTGYGRLGFEGEHYYAHRFMCELVHGAAPSPDHEVAHSCGNGMRGCVNPRHLEWKTRSENHLDRRRHGTHATSVYGPRGKLTSAQRMEILALKGKLPQRTIAARYGVHFETISRIHRTDPNKPKKLHGWWPEEDEALRQHVASGATAGEIGSKMGRTASSISARMTRLKIASQRR